MDLQQRKLTKAEWNSIEVPVSSDEKRIIDLIKSGYNNIQIKKTIHYRSFNILKFHILIQLMPMYSLNIYKMTSNPYQRNMVLILPK